MSFRLKIDCIRSFFIICFIFVYDWACATSWAFLFHAADAVYFASLQTIHSLYTAGACFDWYPVSCEPPENKEKKKKKYSKNITENVVYWLCFCYLINFE